MTDLPSLDQPQAYVVVGPDDQRGPYTLELLIGEVVAGRLNEATPVWWPGLTDWTTMSAHPGLADEIAARRAPAPAAPSSSAPAPTAPASTAPASAAPSHGQHAQVEYGYGQSGGGYPAASAPGQDFSTGSYTGADAMPVDADVSPEPAEEPGAPVSPVDQPVTQYGQPVQAEDATELSGETVAAGAPGEDVGVFGVGATPAEGGSAPSSEAVPVDVDDLTPADFAAVDTGQAGYRSSGAAEGLDPAQGAAFAEVIRRSRARADAAAIVEALDGAIAGSVRAAAGAQGYEPVGRADNADRHVMTFRSGDETLEVEVDRVTGADMAVRDGHVDLDVACTSTTYGGGADAGTGEHGEIVVAVAEGGSSSRASVALMLPLSDYTTDDLAPDEDALRRDIEAVVASVRARLG